MSQYEVSKAGFGPLVNACSFKWDQVGDAEGCVSEKSHATWVHSRPRWWNIESALSNRDRGIFDDIGDLSQISLEAFLDTSRRILSLQPLIDLLFPSLELLWDYLQIVVGVAMLNAASGSIFDILADVCLGFHLFVMLSDQRPSM